MYHHPRIKLTLLLLIIENMVIPENPNFQRRKSDGGSSKVLLKTIVIYV